MFYIAQPPGLDYRDMKAVAYAEFDETTELGNLLLSLSGEQKPVILEADHPEVTAWSKNVTPKN
jgi:hypothetical protein